MYTCINIYTYIHIHINVFESVVRDQRSRSLHTISKKSLHVQFTT